MKNTKTYAIRGLRFGIVIGILLTIFVIFITYKCNFYLSPGGPGSIPVGYCEGIVSIFYPILFLFGFSRLFADMGIILGFLGFAIPSILLITICSGIGAFLGSCVKK